MALTYMLKSNFPNVAGVEIIWGRLLFGKIKLPGNDDLDTYGFLPYCSI